MSTRPRDPIAWEDSLGIRPSSPAWRATVRALYGSPLTDDETKLLDRLSGGAGAPEGGSLDFLGVVGRRGGKSSTIARIAVFEALYGDHGIALEPGQVGTFAVVCPKRDQAKEVLRYVAGLAALPAVSKYTEGDPTADTVAFKTRVSVAVMTADATTSRGFTYVGIIADELAFWPDDDAAQSDHAILDAMVPGLAPIEGAPPRRFLAITSANLEEGVAFETYRDCYGKRGAASFVVSGTTIDFNPNVDRAWLARRQAKRPAAYLREHESVWGGVVESGFFPPDAVTACTTKAAPPKVAELAQSPLYAAIDAAFVSDRFALALARVKDGGIVEIVGVWVWGAPKGQNLSAKTTAESIATMLVPLGVRTVAADQHAFAPLEERFREAGLYLEQHAWTAQNKPDVYRAFRSDLIDGRVSLPDDVELRKELGAIRAKARKTGGETIEARRGHDDRVSAVALAYSRALRNRHAPTAYDFTICLHSTFDDGFCPDCRGDRN